jgi:hypothetical protein
VKAGTKLRLVSTGLAVTLAMGFLTAMAAPASAAVDPNALKPQSLSITEQTIDANGQVQTVQLDLTVRALSPDEVRARGLVAPGTKVGVRAASVVDARSAPVGSGQSSREPVKRPAGGISPTATYCWSEHWEQGRGSGVFRLYVATDVSWCATDTWISSTWDPHCYGIDGGYPSYEFMDCSWSQAYGVGWSAWDVQTVGHLCILYYGWCASTVTEIAKIRMNGYGGAEILYVNGDWPYF